MHVSLFDFTLPEDRIALRPVSPRDAAKLLVVRPNNALRFDDRIVRDLPSLLQPGDVLVANDTRVIPARLYGVRVRGEARARIEVLLHQRLGADLWRAFLRPAKKVEIGEQIIFGDDTESPSCLLSSFSATLVEKHEGGDVNLQFAFSGPALDEAIARFGHLPLPPYIAGKRAEDERDKVDYQTLFAKKEGAVAAPTAGLHFTPELMARLEEQGITTERVTLHVGAGTFLPMKADDTRDHTMHAEWGEVQADVAARLNEARAKGGRIVAIGTTSLRLLESAVTDEGVFKAFSGETDIFITPGYRFKAVDALMTNFHLPKSTLFMLVSAFSGLDCMKDAYAHAIAHDYRFYSYGDASLLFPQSETE